MSDGKIVLMKISAATFGYGGYQDAQFVKAVKLLADTLDKAKKRHVSELIGVPVELTFDKLFGKLESWRVLEEVI